MVTLAKDCVYGTTAPLVHQFDILGGKGCIVSVFAPLPTGALEVGPNRLRKLANSLDPKRNDRSILLGDRNTFKLHRDLEDGLPRPGPHGRPRETGNRFNWCVANECPGKAR